MWTFRIIKEKDLLGDWYYSVKEYMEGMEMWTEDECSPYGDTRDEMRVSLTHYIDDIANLPILVVEDGKIIGHEEPLVELLDNEG